MRARIQAALTLMLAAGTLASTTAVAQTTVSTGPGYANEVYYSLDNGTVRAEPLADWDIGFQISGYASSIITNGGAGVQLFAVPNRTADAWAGAVDTAGMLDSWDLWHNSTESWDLGAFNMDFDYQTGNFGWGEYNVNTHIVTGSTIYVIVLPDGKAKKIMIDRLTAGTYSFRYADLDGSNEVTASVSKSNFLGKNFGYYSIRDGKTVDREPATEAWDLVFGKYVTYLGPGIPYGVTGVRSNVGVTTARIKTGSPTTIPAPGDVAFTPVISTIGYDWKSFTGTGYKVSDSLAFFVKRNVDGAIFRIIFTEFGGSANGNFVFNQQLMSAASVRDEKGNTTTAAIHPSSTQPRGSVEVVYSLDRTVTGARALVHDVTGRIISSIDLDGTAGMHSTTFTAPDAAGLYFVAIECGQRRLSRQLLVR